MKLSSGLKKTSVALFSCESNGAIETLGECDVKLIHADFQCISPVIVASNLAHDCLIGMNVLTKWPTMNNAINVLRRVKINKIDSNFNPSLTSTRLHNICLPKLLIENRTEEFDRKIVVKTDDTFGSKLLWIENQLKESMTDVFPEEIVTEVREEEYVKDYLDSPNLQKILIDFIKIASQDKGKESEIKYETLEYEKFGNVEEMVKHTFPNLLAEDD